MKLDAGHPLQEIGECYACMLARYDTETVVEVLGILCAIAIGFSTDEADVDHAIADLALQIKAELETDWLSENYKKQVELGRQDAEKDEKQKT